MRRVAGALIALASIVGSLLAANPPIEDCFRGKINVERTSRSIPALKPDATLTSLARAQADRMADAETIFHNDQLGQQAPNSMYVGENVGMGPSCDAIHAAFMSSPGHRANILDTDYTRLGVGVTVRDDTIYVAEVFSSTPTEPKPPTAKPPATKKPQPRCTCPR